MRKNNLYKQFEAAATGLTIEQVQNATKQQAADLLNISLNSFSDTFFNNMKALLIQTKKDSANQAILSDLKVQAVTWLANNFLGTEFEITAIGDKRKVILWLDGKPEEEE